MVVHCPGCDNVYYVRNPRILADRFEQRCFGEEAGRVEGGEGSVVGADDERDLCAAKDGGVAAAQFH